MDAPSPSRGDRQSATAHRYKQRVLRAKLPVSESKSITSFTCRSNSLNLASLATKSTHSMFLAANGVVPQLHPSLASGNRRSRQPDVVSAYGEHAGHVSLAGSEADVTHHQPPGDFPFKTDRIGGSGACVCSSPVLLRSRRCHCQRNAGDRQDETHRQRM